MHIHIVSKKWKFVKTILAVAHLVRVEYSFPDDFSCEKSLISVCEGVLSEVLRTLNSRVEESISDR
jgi:hypothetical protein